MRDRSDDQFRDDVGSILRPKRKTMSAVEAIVADFRARRAMRRKKGQAACIGSDVTPPMSPERREAYYRAQRQGGALTARQLRRLRHTQWTARRA